MLTASQPDTTRNSDDSSNPPASRGFPLLALLAVLALAFVLYAPRLKDFFLSDDFGFLWSCWRPGGLFATDGWISGNDPNQLTTYFRFMPFVSLSGALIYWLSGLDPLGWHLANLILHLANSLLVGVLVRRLIRSDWAAIAAAGLFAVYYIHAEAVVYISARTVLLVTLFILATIVVESRSRQRLWGPGRWIGLALAVSAFLSKEDSIVLPLLLSIVPEAPLSVTESLAHVPHSLRTEWSNLTARARRLWPYWALGGVYLLTRLGAILQATQARAYRLELNFNVLKNALFAAVANLVPSDFRTALDAWNRWYKAGEHSALVDLVLAHPGIIVTVIVAVIIWLAVLLWGNRVARRLTVFMIFATLPILLFRGTGERLLYLSSVGAAGAIAAILAGWHVAFGEMLGRTGKFIAPCLFIILMILHASWLRDKEINWESAASLSQTVVSASVELGQTLPPSAVIHLTDLPDNVGGAWVLRTSMESAFRIYAGRPDVTYIADTSAVPGSLREELQRFRWDGTAFVRAD